MSEAKQPTAQGISRLLGGAGYQRSTTSKSRIRGLPNVGSGYEVKGYGDGAVYVRHRMQYPRDAEALRMLAKYAEAIREAGYGVREPGGEASAFFAELTVTAGPA
jgi:hypothetical protein